MCAARGGAGAPARWHADAPMSNLLDNIGADVASMSGSSDFAVADIDGKNRSWKRLRTCAPSPTGATCCARVEYIAAMLSGEDPSFTWLVSIRRRWPTHRVQSGQQAAPGIALLGREEQIAVREVARMGLHQGFDRVAIK